MPQGTLANLANSAFVRTPPLLAERIVRCLLSFPLGKATNILDPTAGEGDLLLPCRDIPYARLYGVEISAERTSVARQRLPQVELITCAFEGVSIPKGSMSLVLANPPYFFQDGKRAEYRILADAGTLLVPGGVLVAIIPARSAWDGTMINHWCRWYDRVHVWKFPDRTSPEDEGSFEEFTQICVVGIRRTEPRDPIPAEARRLQGFRYHTPSVVAPGKSPSRVRAGWEQGTPPPELPITPIPDPYPIPESLACPHIVVRHADESLLLSALERTGAHLTPTWQAATEWHEEGLRDQPIMPLSGEAHVAAEVLTGLLDGEIVWGPVMPPAQANHAQLEQHQGTPQLAPHLLTAFVGQEWVSMPVETEEREKLRERGVVRVAMRQWQDKPILGVLSLETGETRYEQGEAVFTFLSPWLSTLAARVVEKRQPLYRLDPAEWELRVVSQFGRDKQLPNAAFPGLSLAQQHRVYAMGRALDASGRSAIQGEPGTGKVRRMAA
jgi:SAM-dependent methyltransferase